MSPQADYYAVLGLEREASPEDIRRAYHRFARKLHPDVNEEAGATELFLEVQEAYETLSNPERRIEYDKTLPPVPKSSMPAVDLSILYSRASLMRLNEPQLIYVLMELSTTTKAQAVPSLPLNLCLVIDRSTSMQGERMDMVKATAIELVRQIKPEDSLSIVAFSDRADVLVSASQRLARPAVEDQIKQITTGGGTEIFHGLESGYMEVRSKANRSFVNHIILITDGRTYGDEAACMNIAAQAAGNGIGISALGIGDEWNDVFLDALTSRTGGSTVYVSRAGDIKQYLWEKFTGLGQAYADRVNLELDFTPGTELTYAFRLSPDVAPLQSTSPIPLGSIPYHPNLSILLELKIPFVRAQNNPYTFAQGRVTFNLPGKSHSGFGLPVVLASPVTTTSSIQPPPTRLLQAMSRLNLYRMQERANQSLSEGNRESATRHLQNLATHLFAHGKHELARAVLKEVDQIQHEQDISHKGKKRIKYGTRALLLPPNLPPGLSEDDPFE